MAFRDMAGPALSTLEDLHAKSNVSIDTTNKRTNGTGSYLFNLSAATGYFDICNYQGDGQASATNSVNAYIVGYLRVHARPDATTRIIQADLNLNGSPQGVFGGDVVEVRLTSSGTLLLLYNNSFTMTQIGSASGALTNDVWYRIEVKLETLNGAATIEAKIDGTAFATGTGLTVAWTGVGQVWFGSFNSATVNLNWTDCAWRDATGYIGGGEVAALVPNAAGSSAGFAAGTGATFAEVDDWGSGDADGDTTYIASTGANEKTLLRMNTATSAGVGSTILATKSILRARTGSGTASVNERLKSGATENSGINPSLNTSYTTRQGVRETDPNTSAAWTRAALDALELGVVRDAGTDPVRVTALAMLVWSDGAVVAAGHPSGSRHRGIPGMNNQPRFGRGW